MHAENIFVGFVVPENKIFYAALLYKILNTKEGKRKKIKIANARQKKQSLEANSTLGSNFALTDQSVSGGGGGGINTNAEV